MARFRTQLALATMVLLVLAPHLSAQSRSATTRDPGALAYELLRSSQEAYQGAREEIHHQSTNEETMTLRLFNVWAGSKILFDRIVADAPAQEIEEVLAILHLLEEEADDAVDRSHVTRSMLSAWTDAQAALSLLLRHYELPGAATSTGDRAQEQQQQEEQEEEEPDEAEGLTVRITETDWLGGFTPDLEVRGVFEGRNLARAELFVNANGKTVYSDESQLTRQLEMATQGVSKREEVRVDWRLRIDDDDLGSGENRIVVRLTDESGRTSEAELTVRKRLF